MKWLRAHNFSFGIVGTIVIVAVITVAIGAAGLITYTHDHSKATNLSASTLITSTPSLVSARKSTAQTVRTTQRYLYITQWGVRLTLSSVTSSLYYYINPKLPDVAYLSLQTIANVAPDCAADKYALGAIYRLTDAEQQSARASPTALNNPGTIQVGSYWYGFQGPQSACASPALNSAVSSAAPSFDGTSIQSTFKTIETVPATIN